MQPKSIKTLTLSLALLTPTLTSAANTAQPSTKWYLGLGIQNRHMDFKKDLGDNVFTKKDHREVRPFIGLELNDHFALEVGYQQGKSQKVDRSFAANETIFGHTITLQNSHPPEYYKVNYKQLSYTFDLIGKTKAFFNQKINFFVNVGVNLSNLRLSIFNYQQEGAPGVLEPTNSSEERIKYTKAVPRVGLGVNLMLSKNLGLSGTIGLEQINRLHKRFEYSRVQYHVSPRRTVYCGAKIFYKF